MRSNVKIQKVLISGNEAIGEAAIRAGCRFYAGYPITPQNELTAYMARRMNDIGGGFVQAESETAAINMVFGAAAAGTRAMTSSSSPGISLKQEGISYLSACQLPALIVNVMRAGPGLGNIGPAQSDYFQATKGGGHGDYNLVVLAPASVQESFDLTSLAFELADKYRNPVMILTDAFIGQMAESIIMRPPMVSEIKKVKPWALTGAKNRPANVICSLFLQEGRLEEHNLELQRKYRTIRDKEARYEGIDLEAAEIVCVAYGISFRIAREAARLLSSEARIGIFRPITLWPYPYEALKRACRGKKSVFVFELSYGQMVEDVKIALGDTVPVHFYGRSGGGVFSEQELAKYMREQLAKKCPPAVQKKRKKL